MFRAVNHINKESFFKAIRVKYSNNVNLTLQLNFIYIIMMHNAVELVLYLYISYAYGKTISNNINVDL